jgi:hypothetical protein
MPAAAPAAANGQPGVPTMPGPPKPPAHTAAPSGAPAARPPQAPPSAAAPSPPARQQPQQLGLPALRQLFFDQPTEPAALRARLSELEALRRTRVFPDSGALWDQLLAHLRRYLQLLERRQAEGGAPAAEASGQLTCDMCAKRVDAGQLRRMQVSADSPPCHHPRAGSRAGMPSLTCMPPCTRRRLAARRPAARGPSNPLTPLAPAQLLCCLPPQGMGRPAHMAVCSACSLAQLGRLMPLTPTWLPDMASLPVSSTTRRHGSSSCNLMPGS